MAGEVEMAARVEDGGGGRMSWWLSDLRIEMAARLKGGEGHRR